MEDVYDLIKNVEQVYDSNTSFQVLKDFERVLEELDLYVYKNWQDGELLSGPQIDRHWITCRFMWERANMPDPMGAKRLSEYDCKIGYAKSYIVRPRPIRTQDDVRPNSRKGKLDRHPIWVVEIQMPKKLVADIYNSYAEEHQFNVEPAVPANTPPLESQDAEDDVLDTENMSAGENEELGAL
jgi:hypothetical protein|tara:strand:- start:1277 stop:1825 length:549 start_codon:yes stop_codon:yes gene_type:complete